MVEKLIYHRETKKMNASVDILALLTNVKKIFKKIIFVLCSEDCDVCKGFLYNKEYNSARWDKNVDGYLICGTCHEKLGCEDICTSCFCKCCYVSEDEWCDCALPIN